MVSSPPPHPRRNRGEGICNTKVLQAITLSLLSQDEGISGGEVNARTISTVKHYVNKIVHRMTHWNDR
jgi:hypothetical protein